MVWGVPKGQVFAWFVKETIEMSYNRNLLKILFNKS